MEMMDDILNLIVRAQHQLSHLEMKVLMAIGNFVAKISEYVSRRILSNDEIYTIALPM